MPNIQPRTATVDIYQGDHLDRLRHLEARHEAALNAEKSGPPLRNGEIPESQEIFEAHKALMAEAEESKIELVLFALGRRQWRALVAEHKPRKGNPSDEGMGVNEDTFKEALVPPSLAFPLDHERAGEEQITADDLDRISDIDYDRLYLTAFALNRAPAANPKALVLPQTTKSDES